MNARDEKGKKNKNKTKNNAELTKLADQKLRGSFLQFFVSCFRVIKQATNNKNSVNFVIKHTVCILAKCYLVYKFNSAR